MKKMILSLLILAFSAQAFADCRPRLQQRLDSMSREGNQVDQNMINGAVVGGFITLAAPVIGLTLVGLVSVGSAPHYIRKSNLKGLIRAVDEAYIYQETGKEGRKLKRLLRKVNRKLKSDISIAELSNSIIDSNETNSLCFARNMSDFAGSIHFLLEE